MTDLEKNEAVARKLYPDLKCMAVGPGPELKKFLYFNDKRMALPDYCHSIEAAWEIVEHESEKGFWLRRKGEVWQAIFLQWAEPIGENQILSEYQSPTAPLAIVDAFLKLP